jgi:hypothetical protein
LPVATIPLRGESVFQLRFTPGASSLIIGANRGSAHVLHAPSLAELAREDTAEWIETPQPSPSQVNSDSRPSHSGAIQDWLFLGPISYQGQGLAGAGLEPLPAETLLRVREGATWHHSGGTNAWHRSPTRDGLIELPPDQSPGVDGGRVAFALCFVVAPREIPDCVIEVGSSYEYALYLNGSLMLEYAPSRIRKQDAREYPRVKDRTSTVRLKSGVNALLMKIVATAEPWTGSVKLSDAHGKPVPGVHKGVRPSGASRHLGSTERRGLCRRLGRSDDDSKPIWSRVERPHEVGARQGA